MVDVVFNNFTTDRTRSKNFFEKVLSAAAEETGLSKKKIELSVNLVGEGRIKSLNKKYRGKNRITDVLSFPLIFGHRKTGEIFGLAMTEGVTEGVSFPLQARTDADRTLTHGDKGHTRSHANHRLVTSNAVNDIISLGDIFICLPVAKKYAVREGVGLNYKLAFLTVHGFLHLLGYDHETPKDEEEMFKLQDAMLSKAKL